MKIRTPYIRRLNGKYLPAVEHTFEYADEQALWNIIVSKANECVEDTEALGARLEEKMKELEHANLEERRL